MKKIMSALSVLFVIGSIVLKCVGPDLIKESIKSQYHKSDDESKLEQPVRFKLGDDYLITLYPDGSAKEDGSNTPMNWQELEGTSEGETYSFIYVYKMEDTSKPVCFLTEDETGYVFRSWVTTLDEFVTWATYQQDEEIYGDISTNLLVSAIKTSKKTHPSYWEQYTCYEDTSVE